MVNHEEEDFTWIYPPKYQDAHIYCRLSGDGLKHREVLQQVEHYSIAVNQVMVATVNLLK